MTFSVSLTAFTRAPGKVLALLDDGGVVLTRKNGPPLQLTLLLEGRAVPQPPASPEPDRTQESGDPSSDPAADRSAQPSSPTEEGLVLSAVAAYASSSALAAALGRSCPWADSLPAAAQRVLVDDVSRAIRSGAADCSADVATALRRWREVSARFVRD